MRRLKVYLDTSVVSYLYQQDTPENSISRRRSWRDVILLHPGILNIS